MRMKRKDAGRTHKDSDFLLSPHPAGSESLAYVCGVQNQSHIGNSASVYPKATQLGGFLARSAAPSDRLLSYILLILGN